MCETGPLGAWEWAGVVALALAFGPILLYLLAAVWLTMWLQVRQIWEDVRGANGGVDGS
jgi:hypothetical protein